MTITVDGPLPGPFRWSIIISEHRDGLALDDALTHALRDIDEHENADGRIQLWIRHVDDEADTIVASLGFRRYRDLWQLRCALVYWR